MARIFALLIIASLFSCTSPQDSPLMDLSEVTPNQSRLVVVSTADGLDGVVVVDGEIQRLLPKGGLVSLDLNPGHHRVEFYIPGVSHSNWFQTPSFPPGETLYYSVYPTSSFRANRSRAIQLGMPIDDGPFLNEFGPNGLNFRRITREEAAKIPLQW